MKIACCQFAPRWGDRDANMAFADSLLERIEPGNVDLLVLPEMAFTGYVFNNLDEIMPFLEDKDSGPSVQWAKKQAKRLECFVVVGYPEIEGENRYYNSLCCVNPQGDVVATYRKTFLYTTDENWAMEGPGFQSQLIPGLGKVGFGICMDINPYRFEADFEAYEFANYHAREQSEIIICSMAWIRGQGVMDTIGYWAARVWPLREHCQAHSIPHMYFVACNRTGTERGVNFAGGSSILDLCGPKIRLLNYMDEDDQGVMIFDTNLQR